MTAQAASSVPPESGSMAPQGPGRSGVPAQRRARADTRHGARDSGSAGEPRFIFWPCAALRALRAGRA
jgi:hypothetical protein